MKSSVCVLDSFTSTMSCSPLRHQIQFVLKHKKTWNWDERERKWSIKFGSYSLARYN